MNARRALAILAALLGMAALVITVLRLDPFVEPADRSLDTFGRDALGHGALREILDRTDVPVLVDREGVAEYASGVVMFIEPSPDRRYGEHQLDLQTLLRLRQLRGLPSVVVLPKWRLGYESGTEVARRIDKDDADAVLDAIMPWGADLRREDIDIPQTAQLREWTVPGARGDRRVVLQERQTLRLDDPALDPLLGTRRSALVARVHATVGDGSLVVVSDPDLLHNFNLHRGDHAVIAKDLVAYSGSDAVVIDEVLHGHGYSVTWPAALGAWPTRIVVAHALLLALLYALAVARRFGPPRPAPRPAGAGPLVDLAAEAMVGTPSRTRRLVTAYVCAVIASVADRLGVPGSADLGRRAHGVDEAAARLGIETDARALLIEVTSEGPGRNPLALARDAHRMRRAALSNPQRGTTQGTE